MNLAGQSATWGWQCTPDWDRGDLTHSLTHSPPTTVRWAAHTRKVHDQQVRSTRMGRLCSVYLCMPSTRSGEPPV